MTVGFALEMIPRRMKELGHGDNYLLKWRHMQLDASTEIEIRSHADFHYLIAPNESIIVMSNMGCFDLQDTAINEFQYEHRGNIKVRNKSAKQAQVLFIQATPKHCKPNSKSQETCQESHLTIQTCGCSVKDATKTEIQ